MPRPSLLPALTGLLLLVLLPTAHAQLAPPQSFGAYHDGYENVTLVWTEPFTNDDIVQYWIYRDGNHLYTAPATATELAVILPEPGSYSFTARALYDGGLSSFTDPVNVTWYDASQGSYLEAFENGLPDSWTIEANAVTNSWHIEPGGNNAAFPTDHVYVLGNAQIFTDSYDILISQPMDFSDAGEVILRFDTAMEAFTITTDECIVNVRVDGTDHQVAQWINETFDGQLIQLDVSNHAAGQNDVQIVFHHISSGFFGGGWWALDNVEVISDISNEQPVVLNLLPAITDVPSGGGAIYYDIHLTSTLDITVPGLSYWTWVTTPGGDTVGPLGITPWTHTPQMDATVLALGLAVPGFAPAGNYQFHGGAGFYPNIQLADSFPFEKHAGDTAAPPFAHDPAPVATGGWASLGNARLDGPNALSSDEEISTVLPSSPALTLAGPNPFNPTTAVTLHLPQASEARVVLVNTLGRQVAELQPRGMLPAGTHSLLVDGRRLASGVYLVRASVEGQTFTRKLVLMK